MPSANVTLVAAVGALNSGNKPITFDTKISSANVATTGKYLTPGGPTTSIKSWRIPKPVAASVCCPLDGSSSESFPFKTQISPKVSKQATTNIIVYHGIAFSGVSAPKAASGVVPKFARNLVQSGRARQ